MTYLAVLEKGPKSWSAWIPDLPVCFTPGETLADLRTMIREAIDSHIEALRDDNETIPVPSTIFEHAGGYLVLFQREQGRWQSSVPDLPDCFVDGPSLAIVRERTASTVQAQRKDLVRRNQPAPEPVSVAEYVEVREPVTAPRR